MTPVEWVDERAEQWVAWREKSDRRGSLGYGNSALANMIGLGSYGSGHDASLYVVFDNDACVAFDAALAALVEPLRVVVMIHWLGSERMQLPASSPAEQKAGACGVSRRTYFRYLDEARGLLYVALR